MALRLVGLMTSVLSCLVKSVFSGFKNKSKNKTKNKERGGGGGGGGGWRLGKGRNPRYNRTYTDQFLSNMV